MFKANYSKTWLVLGWETVAWGQSNIKMILYNYFS